MGKELMSLTMAPNILEVGEMTYNTDTVRKSSQTVLDMKGTTTKEIKSDLVDLLGVINHFMKAISKKTLL